MFDAATHLHVKRPQFAWRSALLSTSIVVSKLSARATGMTDVISKVLILGAGASLFKKYLHPLFKLIAGLSSVPENA